MLVIETSQLVIAIQPDWGIVAAGPKSFERYWQAGIMTAIATPSCENGKIGLRHRLHISPNLKRWYGSRAKEFAIWQTAT